MYHKAVVADPLQAGFYANLAVASLGQRQLDAAEQTTRKALIWIRIVRGYTRDADKEADPIGGPRVRAMAQQIGPEHQKADAALHSYIAKYGQEHPYNVADLYVLRK